MRTLRFAAALAVASLLLAAPAVAQEGHPLKGSWLGTWGPSEEHVNSIIVILDWDGDNITGIINPGTDNVEITNATLNPDGWVVSIEADFEADDGDTLHFVAEGTIDNLAFHDRTITGTWEHEEGSGQFQLQRQ